MRVPVLDPATGVDQALADNRDAAWASVDPRLLELCRLRVAMLLGHRRELASRSPGTGLDEATIAELAAWPTSERFTALDRAVLGLVEQFVIDVAALSDEQAGAVADHLGPGGLADLVSALLVVEQRQRLSLAWERLGLVHEEDT